MNIDDLITSLKKIKESMSPEEQKENIMVQSPFGVAVEPIFITYEKNPRISKIILQFNEPE